MGGKRDGQRDSNLSLSRQQDSQDRGQDAREWPCDGYQCVTARA
jgi:hypothetical protein